jgi:hypothetical protein
MSDDKSEIRIVSRMKPTLFSLDVNNTVKRTFFDNDDGLEDPAPLKAFFNLGEASSYPQLQRSF